MNQFSIFKIGDTVWHFYKNGLFKIKEVGFIISRSEVFGLYEMKVTKGKNKNTFYNHISKQHLTPCRILLIEKTILQNKSSWIYN